jgi:uncharacterized Zn finger protein (UPF0148 family)/nitrate reductase NapE component
MSSYKCLTCGATVFGDSFGRRFICSTCEQTEAIKKQGELDRQAADRRAQEQEYQFEQQQRLIQESMWQQRHQAELNRKATVNAILDAARYSAEAGQSTEDIRQYSLTYIADEWATGSNPHGMTIYFDEDGQYQFMFENPPYLTPHLANVFKKGIQETINQWTPPSSQYIIDNVRSAGEHELANFYIPWTVPETGYAVNSKIFYTNLNADVNPVNGILSYQFTDSFKSAVLNDAYRSGIENLKTRLNGYKERQERLNFIAEQRQKRNKEQAWELFSVLTVGIWPIWLIVIFVAWVASL